MDSENAIIPSDILVCSTTPNLTSQICSLASTSVLTPDTDGLEFSVESTSKPKKKRSKPKQR